MNEKAEKIKEMKKEADLALQAALPTLENATKALDTLNRGVTKKIFIFNYLFNNLKIKKDIAEIKNNNKPAELVKYTLEAVAILLDEKTDWDSIKKV